jgi:hypothetical protein
MKEKPQPVRSPVLPVGAAREAEELRLVTEIVLGRALEGDPPAGVERTKSSPARAGHTAGGVWKVAGRAIGIAQEAYRGAVAQMQRLTIRQDADIEADAREAIEEKALAEDAARKAGEAAPAEGDLARERVRNQELEKQLSIRQNDQKLVAQERARTQALEQQLAARADEQKLLAQERARTRELEQQLSIRQFDQKLVAQERARNQALEQQLAARADEQKLLAQERARNQALEQQLADRADEQKLLAQERARTQALEQQLAARADEQRLLAQERARTQALEQQLSIRQNDQKLVALERARIQELEQQLLARADEQKLFAEERARTRELEQQLSMGQADQKLPAPEASGSLEAARLVEQGRLLLNQGKITAARSMLKDAAESGSTLALFLLAETYDPAILSDWGIFSVWGIFGRDGGRRGNVSKARELYAKAAAGGVHEAKYRLSALRT